MAIKASDGLTLHVYYIEVITYDYHITAPCMTTSLRNYKSLAMNTSCNLKSGSYKDSVACMQNAIFQGWGIRVEARNSV